MGNKVSATDVGLTEKQVEEWQKKYGLSKQQVNQFLLFFKTRKGRDGTLSRADFVEVMVLAGSPVEVAEQMFQSVDIDGSGTMDIQEFLALYGTVGGGSVEEKLEASFKVFDFDGSGTLTPNEIERMFLLALKTRLQVDAFQKKGKRIHVVIEPELERSVKDLVAEIMEKVDTDKNGHLDLQEFKTGFSKHPEICGFFKQY